MLAEAGSCFVSTSYSCKVEWIETEGAILLREMLVYVRPHRRKPRRLTDRPRKGRACSGMERSKYKPQNRGQRCSF